MLFDFISSGNNIIKVENSIILFLAGITMEKRTTSYCDKKFLQTRIYASFTSTLHWWEFQFLTLSSVMPESIRNFKIATFARIYYHCWILIF